MAWELEEAIAYYQKQGAPRDQSAVIALLREIQQERGGISRSVLAELSRRMDTKEGFFLALIKRVSGLRLLEGHTLELCAGPNCGKAAQLAAFAEKNRPKNVELKFVPCMRLCAKGPNLKWDGQLYHRAEEALVRKLYEEA